MMKHSVAALMIVLLLCHISLAESFRLDVGYFDTQGALTSGANNQTPLADGCLGQILEDTRDDGIAVPAVDGAAGDGDGLLRRGDGALCTFTVNGAARLQMPGCFFVSPGFASAQRPRHRIFLRVWNASSIENATGYWDSPLYAVLPGIQQVSFLRGEWCWNTFAPEGRSDPALAATAKLAAFPNPFNSSSRISFALAQEEHVRLSVYDLQARLVTTLVDAPMAAGAHDLVFDGNGLPSGLYFLRMQAGHEVSSVTRLLLLR